MHNKVVVAIITGLYFPDLKKRFAGKPYFPTAVLPAYQVGPDLGKPVQDDLRAVGQRDGLLIIVCFKYSHRPRSFAVEYHQQAGE